MRYTTEKIVMYKDLNLNGTLFGGTALAWLDEAAAIHVMKELAYPANIVTKFISNIDFMAPAKLGEMVEIGMDTVHIGTTSITVRAVLRNLNTKKEILTIDKMVFVNVDSNGVKQPHNIPELKEVEEWMLPTSQPTQA